MTESRGFLLCRYRQKVIPIEPERVWDELNYWIAWQSLFSNQIDGTIGVANICGERFFDFVEIYRTWWAPQSSAELQIITFTEPRPPWNKLVKPPSFKGRQLLGDSVVSPRTGRVSVCNQSLPHLFVLCSYCSLRLKCPCQCLFGLVSVYALRFKDCRPEGTQPSRWILIGTSRELSMVSSGYVNVKKIYSVPNVLSFAKWISGRKWLRLATVYNTLMKLYKSKYSQKCCHNFYVSECRSPVSQGEA